ncbi:MAG: tetratricopeptide repeat protein, partial [Deltaproteobacteria bacterium]|nr:tetratricopeptide repeat protein [Deltaproteobacteria bacterium]
KIMAEFLEAKVKFESESDKKGNWAIGGLGTGRFLFVAMKEGYEPAQHDMNVSQFARNNPLIEFVLKEAQEVPTDVSLIEDEAASSLLQEGNELFAAGHFSGALAVFEEFAESKPSFYQVYINIGNCHKELGRFDEAFASFQKVLDKVEEEKGSYEGDENAARALASAGETSLKQGKFDEAAEYLKQAQRSLPDDETLAFNIGEIYFKQGDTASGIEYYRMASEIKTDWGPPYRQLGYAYLNKGDYQLALDNFKKFLEVAPDAPQAEAVLALLPSIENLIKK